MAVVCRRAHGATLTAVEFAERPKQSSPSRRCPETGGLEFDHIDGYARTHVHDPDLIRLLCDSHNQQAAEQLYGRAFMDKVRVSRKSTRAGASSQARLF